VLHLQTRVDLEDEQLAAGSARRRFSPSAPAKNDAGDGVSSTIFWCRRCTLHSRSPRAYALPCVSQKTCTSMCRGCET
jgi:hypothetical protein